MQLAEKVLSSRCRTGGWRGRWLNVLLFEGRLQGVDSDDDEVGLYFIEPGDFCGELALFDAEPQSEFVIALTAAVVVFVPVKELQRVMLPAIMGVVGSKLASRIRQMTFQRSLLGLPSIGPGRIATVAFDPRWRKTEIQRIQSE